MFTQLMGMEDHACLWADLAIHARHVEGSEDITIGTHPQLGACVVSHYGPESTVEWVTRLPIPAGLIPMDGAAPQA